MVATFAAVTFYMGRASEQSKRMWAESQLEEVLKVKATLEQEKEELTKAKADLEAKVEALNGQVTSLMDKAKELADEIATERQAVEDAKVELTSTQAELDDAAGRLDTERREKLALADELAKAKQDTKKVQDDLTQLRQAKEALERRVKEMMTAGTSPETIVVTPSSGAAPATTGAAIAKPAPPVQQVPPLKGAPTAAASAGTVLVVNREFNFIVVSFGEKDGLKPGQFLEVLRANRVIGKVQVERVYENMSAANLLPEQTKTEIKEGDVVRRG
ncbi:MAG: hypothetical protein A3C53_02935 [Omnitrophica WOR_2 bacterium RIFCSPHIGHO2_02_FULL_68_15]|nr:MAG: hypothetical protein A3C53_02935 [Omnitrophica WOR_2 bacterium RIFCSPHIGHO2_02_FULL_68_15]